MMAGDFSDLAKRTDVQFQEDEQVTEGRQTASPGLDVSTGEFY